MARRPRVLAVLVSTALIGAAALVAAVPSAGATTTGSMSVTVTTATVLDIGDAADTVTITVKNTSPAAEGGLTVPSGAIVLTPSCGAVTKSCATPDVGVFTTSSTAHSACVKGGLTVAAVSGSSTGAVQLNGAALSIKPAASCAITLTVSPQKLPAVDSDSGTAGYQTRMFANAHGTTLHSAPTTFGSTAVTVKARPTLTFTQATNEPVGQFIGFKVTISTGQQLHGELMLVVSGPDDPGCTENVTSGGETVTANGSTISLGVSFSHPGEYRLVASYTDDNATNESVTTPCNAPGSTVIVYGPPGPPDYVTAEAGSGQARVSWTAPANDGGSPPTEYTVTPYLGATAQSPIVFHSAATTETVTGLTNGATYTFRVVATNIAGAGPPSNLSTAVTIGQPWLPFVTSGAAVDRIYHDLLGRAPTTAERTAAVDAMDAGTSSPGALAAQLRSDPDQTGKVDPVTRLYRAYFLRIPDQGGLVFWIGKRRAGTSLDTISSAFAGSAEFTSRYGSLTNAQFVELVYENVLGRTGDAAGISYWTAQLDGHHKTRGQVMTGFSESAEYKNHQAGQVTSAVFHILLLGRAPTTTEYADDIAAVAAGLTTRGYADILLNTPEYATHIGG